MRRCSSVSAWTSSSSRSSSWPGNWPTDWPCPALLDYLALGEGVLVREVVVEKWSGKTLRELQLPASRRAQVVAWKRVGERRFSFVPSADEPLNKGDVLVVLGDAEDVIKVTG